MLTQNEEHGAHYHSSRQDMLRALLVCCSVHGPELVCYWMCPEISKKERTNKNGQGSIAGTLGYFHFDWTNGIHIEVQDHDKKDNCGERHDERKPRLNLTLEMKTDNTKHCQYSTGGEQISQCLLIIYTETNTHDSIRFTTCQHGRVTKYQYISQVFSRVLTKPQACLIL